MSADILDSVSQVMLKYFWGWSPDGWGTLSFTKRGRLRTVIGQTDDPFIAVACLPLNADDRDAAGKVTGFYVVSHIEGHRDEFTIPASHIVAPDRWKYGLKATRAFSFLPEYRIATYDLVPGIENRVRAVGMSGEWLDQDKIDRLKQIPYEEVSVFGGQEILSGQVYVPPKNYHGHMVKAGPANPSGFHILGEPPETEKELYVLELVGDASHFLNSTQTNLRIFKIGLSISPQSRLATFRKTLPWGVYGWAIFRSTRRDGHAAYASHYAAEAGERAMKQFLGTVGEKRWLGGEFYAATESEIEAAWGIGRKAALVFTKSSKESESTS